MIEESPITPLVRFEKSSNTLFIEGQSKPENPRKFYLQIIEWLDSYMKESHSKKPNNNVDPNKLKLAFNLWYFNSTSSKMIFDLLSFVQENKLKYDFDCECDWKYSEGDTDMLDSGMEFQQLLGLKFNFISHQ